MPFSEHNRISKFFLDHAPNGIDVAAALFIQFVFWIGIMRYIELPGLHHDAINPDYIAAHTINPQLTNPGGALYTAWFPLLGNLYHGVQNYYFELPVFWFFGLNIVSARIGQALFGAVIVLLVYVVSVRSTGNRLISFIAAAGLASDIAFLASFRTQFYIILSGEVWLFAALCFLPFRSIPQKTFRLNCILSGVCCGLAAYGFFVFLFFLPGFLWLILCHRDIDKRLAVKYRMIGIVVGLFPYALGYVSLFVIFGGIKPGFAWLNQTFFTMRILESTLPLWGRFANAFDLVNQALNNIGNVAMIFSETKAFDDLVQIGFAVKAKIIFMYSALMLGIVFALMYYKKRESDAHAVGRQMVALPLSYFFFAALLGTRLWVHHFSVFVPLFYLVCAIVANEVYQLAKPRLASVMAVQNEIPISIIVSILLFFNLQQQQVFFENLDKTGGGGKATNALSRLAEEAFTAQGKEVYFFPEWGFFPSFNLLTGNRVAYAVEFEPINIQKFAQSGRDIRVPFWKEIDKDKYLSILKHEGIDNVSMRTFYRRDGEPAFYMISASYPKPR